MNAESKRLTGYGLALIAFLLFWIHERFPTEAIRSFLENRLSDPASDYMLTIGRINARFPFTLLLQEIDVQFRGGPFARIDTLTARLSGIRWGGIQIAVSASIAGGRIAGKIGYPPIRNGAWDIRLQFSDVHIDRIPGIQQILGRPIAADVSGNLQPTERGIGLSFVGKHIRIGLTDASLGLTQILFTNGEMRVETDADDIRLASAAFQGTQMSVTATGVLKRAVNNTDNPIRVDASIRFHPGLLLEIRNPGFRELIGSRMDQDVPVRISGTLAQPRWQIDERR